ncbi:hypothetical protein D9M70_633630 [compost metagenome]
MRHVALEIPLRLFAVGGCRQRDDAHDTRIEPLGDALDDAALAGGVTSLEDHHHFFLVVDHPVLQLDQLRLQLQQRAEVIDARDRRRVALAIDLADLFRERRF